MSKQILLIVEDPETLDLATTILENIGYQVKATGDPQVGVTWWRDDSPDLVLFDPRMKLREGHSLHDMVAGDPLLRRPKLLYLVPRAELTQAKTRLGLSTSQTLTTPFEFEDLMNRVQQVIGSAFDD